PAGRFGQINLPVPSTGPGASPPEVRAESGGEPGDDVALSLETEEVGVSAPRVAAATAPRFVGGVVPAELPAKRPWRWPWVAATLAVVVIGGSALALVPNLGPFGAYFVLDRVNRNAHQALVLRSVQQARKLMSADTYSQAQQALQVIESAQRQAPRLTSLPAYAAFLTFAQELRFGSDPEGHARAAVLLADLAGVPETAYGDLARAAQAGVSGQLARARQSLESNVRKDPRNIDVHVVRAEVVLRAHQPEAALEAWQAAAQLEPGARTAFGLARAEYAAGRPDAAEARARATLQRSPQHIDAEILLARILWEARQDEATALKMLEGVPKNPRFISRDSVVEAQSLLGDIHLARSRVSRAEAAYGEALALNPRAARALLGMGNVLYQAGRYSEALARFEACSLADPDDLLAKVGAAKSKFALERLEDANAMLQKLRQSNPESMLVLY
ncbi:MAG TPA: tetratricopeptide repeat protein, partial [Polyangiaceae bacterium]